MVELTDEALAQAERLALSSPDDRRSLVWSIVKTEFGWDGVTPSTFPSFSAAQMVWLAVSDPACNMQKLLALACTIALCLDAHGASWLPRADGQPNRLQVVDGRVVSVATYFAPPGAGAVPVVHGVKSQRRSPPDGWHLLPAEPTPEILDALRIGSRKDWPSDELCRVRYAALLAQAATPAVPGAQQLNT